MRSICGWAGRLILMLLAFSIHPGLGFAYIALLLIYIEVR